MSIRVRSSGARGSADHGWLKTFHTFSFADYYDPKYDGYGSLRVINEDTVAGGTGFGRHGHANFNIFSYVLEGALLHQDSMGNKEVLPRGSVQYTTAGTGIHHSEYNAHADKQVRFLQIWAKPHSRGLAPRYDTKSWSDEDKKNKLAMLISPDGRNGTIKIDTDLFLYASLLEEGKSVAADLSAAGAAAKAEGGAAASATGASAGAGAGEAAASSEGSASVSVAGDSDILPAAKGQAVPYLGYLHVPVMPGSKGVTINDSIRLQPGDGAFIEGFNRVKITGHAEGEGGRAEFVLMQMR